MAIKKITSLLAFLVFFVGYGLTTNAQSIVNKDGDTILPQKGQWGISLDATKLIKDARFDFSSGTQAITVKYFKSNSTAIRIGARIGVSSYVTKEKEIDRLAATSTIIAYPAAEPLKTNTWTRTSTVWGISGGIEKRRGTGRLVGVYGVEGGLFISTLTDNFSYGNALSADPSAPVTVSSADAISSAVFGSANNIDTVPAIQGVQGSARITVRKNSPALTIGARAFIGAEYFVVPRMSIGAEFGWGLTLSYAGRIETQYESIGQSNIQGNTARAVNRTTIDGGTSNFTILDTDNANGIGGASASIRLNVYF